MNHDDIELLGPPPLLSGYYKFGKKYRFNKQGHFVFGSNLRGIHGAGAAAFAAKHFGAKFGKGVGFSGQSYAIPTKDEELRPLPLERIAQYVKEFIGTTDVSTLDDDPEKKIWFYVTPIGTGLAGFRHEDIAPMFEGAVNCWFPDIWKPFLGEYPGIRGEYEEQFIRKINNE